MLARAAAAVEERPATYKVVGDRQLVKAYKGRAVEVSKGQFIKVINTPGSQVCTAATAVQRTRGGRDAQTRQRAGACSGGQDGCAALTVTAADSPQGRGIDEQASLLRTSCCGSDSMGRRARISAAVQAGSRQRRVSRG